ncbi:hypothetical protein Salat_0200000 [Sesamum alatum]|uniref:Uncharacterized protein n=1 Tax=Sesamum alatum TaxID=300844 RepID=A0AAE1YXW4_9LAMI|nr:hypothetical protein Salat_0200000 [Sesamum alatum]
MCSLKPKNNNLNITQAAHLNNATRQSNHGKGKEKKLIFKEVELNDPISVVNHDDALARGLTVAKNVQEQNIGNKDKELASMDNNRPEQNLTEGNITMEKQQETETHDQITKGHT